MSDNYLVIDNGAYNIKAGYNLYSAPLKVRNTIARTKDGALYIGNDYYDTNNYSGISFKWPYTQGNLTSWETEKIIWDYTFDRITLESQDRVSGKSKSKKNYITNQSSTPLDPKYTHLSLTETAFQLPQLSISTDQIVFEEYGFNEYFRSTPALLIPWIDFPDNPPSAKDDSVKKFRSEPKEEEDKDEVKEEKNGNGHSESKEDTKNGKSVEFQDDSEFSDSGDEFSDDDFEERKKKNSKSNTQNGKKSTTADEENTITSNKNFNDFMIIIDSGHDSTWIIPVIYQCVYWDGVRKLPIGGKLLNGLLRELVSFRHYDFNDEPVLINTIKEKTCFMALDFNDYLAKKIKHSCQFVLPDFKTTTTGYVRTKNSPQDDLQLLTLSDERFVPPEAYYHPEIIFDNSSNPLIQSTPFKNIVELVVDSIMACPKVAQPLLLANIVLVGGSTKLPNFKPRLLSELKKELPLDWFVRIRNTGETAQDELAWYGGVNLSKSEIITKISISKQDYFEHGSNWCQKQFGFRNPRT